MTKNYIIPYLTHLLRLASVVQLDKHFKNADDFKKETLSQLINEINANQITDYKGILSKYHVSIWHFLLLSDEDRKQKYARIKELNEKATKQNITPIDENLIYLDNKFMLDKDITEFIYSNELDTKYIHYFVSIFELKGSIALRYELNKEIRTMEINLENSKNYKRQFCISMILAIFSLLIGAIGAIPVIDKFIKFLKQ